MKRQRCFLKKGKPIVALIAIKNKVQLIVIVVTLLNGPYA